MSEVHKIAVIGLPQSGKSSLTKALQELANSQELSAKSHAMQFVEVHDPDELHGHAYDVVLQVVDSTRLEESLMLTPHIIDEHQKIVLAIGRYDLLLETDHSLNIPKLEQLIGVPTCRTVWASSRTRSINRSLRRTRSTTFGTKGTKTLIARTYTVY